MQYGAVETAYVVHSGPGVLGPSARLRGAHTELSRIKLNTHTHLAQISKDREDKRPKSGINKEVQVKG